MISEHISDEEYACRHCGLFPPDLEKHPDVYRGFFDTFERIRERWGRPIPINSGYRCPVHNAEIGGKPLSVHQFGLALDLGLHSATEVDELYRVIEEVCPELRVGTYTRAGKFVHIDVGYWIRPRATRSWHEGARWTG